MEVTILQAIEAEVERRVAVKMANALETISKLYSIPLSRLLKDTATAESSFCKGVLKCGKRCLKQPKENGYCGFHLKQAPTPSVVQPPQKQEELTWDLSEQNRLNI